MAADLARGGSSGSASQGSSLEVCHAAEAARLQRLTQQAPLDYAAVAAVGVSKRQLPQLLQRMPQPLGAGYTFPWLLVHSTLHIPMAMPDCCLGSVALPCPACLLQTLRTLIEMSGGDADRLQLLGEAQGLLAAAPTGAYPPQARSRLSISWSSGLWVALKHHVACPWLFY